MDYKKKKYIDISVLIAEIDRLIADNKKDIERASQKNLEDYFEGYEDALMLFKENILELNESEDEEIRKWLINEIKIKHHNLDEDNVDFVDKALAWLEKQEEKQKSTWSEEDEKELDCIINILDRLGFEEFCKSSRDQDIEEERFYYKEIQFLKRLKYLCPKPKQEWSEEEEPEKPADKVEPKFKVGDWVILRNTIAKILDAQKYAFVGIDVNGNDFVCNYEHLSSLKHWTIQDAKDGDVLAYGQVVFIFKEILKGINNEWLDCYCSAHKDGSFIADSYDLMTSKYFSEVYPATKEQHELLFTKIQEEGYVWDAEKKELKKISTWSENDEKMIDAALQFAHEYGRHGLWCWLKSLKDRV